MVDIDYFKKKRQLIELRYNPYHDPSNGRFTSGGGGGGGFLYSPNKKKGEKGMNGDGSAFYVAPDTLDKGEKALVDEYEKWRENVNAEDRKKILEPATKSDYVDKLEVIAEIGQPTYKVETSVRDWQNYGKDRTYLKIEAYRDSDGKYHHEQDYGYYDNIKNKYVPSQSHNLDRELFTMSGSRPSEKQIDDAIREVKKKR